MYESEESNIIKNWSEEVVVSISCICFNQINYIEETLIGFLKQKTTFRFEILIHDDASSDGTTELIRQYEIKYPHIIKPLYEIENQWSKGRRGSIVFNIPRAKGKYIAFCEGDDYWTDPNKLQMQVDFLENNPEYGMCYTMARVYNQEKQKYLLKTAGRIIKNYNDIYINFNSIATLTVCIRNDLYLKYVQEVEPQEKKWLMGDLPVWLWFYKNSKVRFIKKVTSTYRILKNSASHKTDQSERDAFSNSSYEIRKYFAMKYDEDQLLFQYSSNVKFLKAYRDNNRELAIKYRKDLNAGILNWKNKILFICTYSSVLFRLMRYFLTRNQV